MIFKITNFKISDQNEIGAGGFGLLLQFLDHFIEKLYEKLFLELFN